MRSFWSRVPMLRLAFAIITGIALRIAADNPSFSSPTVLFCAVAVAVALASVVFILVTANIKTVTLAYRLRVYNGFALTIFIIAFAYLLTCLYTQKNYSTDFSGFLSDKNILVVQITEPPVLRDKIVIVNAEVTEVNNNTGHFATTGNIQLSFLKDSVCEQLQYGDRLLINSKIEATTGPKNPYEFDFKTYLAFHNIYYKAFIVSSQWLCIAHNQGYQLLGAIYRLRDSFLKVITLYVPDKNDFGVASAIMLGDNDYINPDVKRAYASSGAVHVLSVSGLHVGIMFLMLNFLLRWMDKRGRKILFAKTFIIITFIWFYACLTGLSPAVLRSAMMFTLFQLGYLFIRNTNTYNIVAGSAVLLMLFNPFVITDVGFQLSYMAVFGIVYMQPRIANFITIKTPQVPHFKVQPTWINKSFTFLQYGIKWLGLKALDFFWQLTAASIAAQIATLPLCLLYFYQFPNLFLLANMIVIPLSNLLLFAGTGLFAVAHIPYLNDIAGSLFNAILVLLNKFIFWIDALPFALTKGVCVSATGAILLYLLIVLLCWLTEERKNKIVISALIVVLILCSLSSFKKIQQRGQKEIVVYSVSKQKAIAFIADKTLYYDIDSALYHNQNDMLFHIYHHWWQSGITDQIALTNPITKAGIYSRTIAQGKIILFEGKKILLVDSSSVFNPYGVKTKLKPDLVIFSNVPKVSIPILKKSVDFNDVIFDSSTKPPSRKRWRKDCSDLNINYWDVNTEGAYVWNLNMGTP